MLICACVMSTLPSMHTAAATWLMQQYPYAGCQQDLMPQQLLSADTGAGRVPWNQLVAIVSSTALQEPNSPTNKQPQVCLQGHALATMTLPAHDLQLPAACPAALLTGLQLWLSPQHPSTVWLQSVILSKITYAMRTCVHRLCRCWRSTLVVPCTSCSSG